MITNATTTGSTTGRSNADYRTPRELAARWRTSTRTLARWRAEGCGPAWIAIGGRILYRTTDVEAFEARHHRPGT